MTAIREARPADRTKLRVIQAATLAEPWPELLDLGVSGPPVLLVATEPEAGPVGYALAVVGDPDRPPAAGADETDEPADSPHAGGGQRAEDGDPQPVGYLVELAVAGPYQGSGRGSALLNRLIERLRAAGCDRLLVTVRERDRRARSFYRERGFECRERLPDHYESGDGFLLERSLGG